MQAIVDRIEGEMAVLEVDGTKLMDVPLAEMPEDCNEGNVYEGGPGAWVKDDTAKAERLKANADLMASLFKH